MAFRRQRLRSPKGLSGFRTIITGRHRIIVACPIKHRRGQCPFPTVAQAILHPVPDRAPRRRRR